MHEHGLQPLPEDPRDFKLGAIVDLPSLDTLPETFELPVLPVRHQGDSDFCTQFTYCELSGQQEGVELEPSWSFAMDKAISNMPLDAYGSDLRSAAKPHVKFGAIERKESPYSLDSKGSNFLRNPEVWPADLVETAAKHKKKTYFSVTGPHDHFDNIRASIYKYNSAVAIGLLWGWSMSQVKIDTSATGGSGHAVPVVGWDGEYLKIKQSYGTDAGENGFQYVHRSVINTNVGKYGAFMFTDMPRDTVEFLLSQSELESMLEKIIDTIRAFFNILIHRK